MKIGKKLILILVFAMLISTNVFAYNFVDINKHWAENYIKKYNDKDILKGYDTGHFKPDSKISRAEFITIINRVFNYQESNTYKFKDVKESDWFYKDICKAYENDYIKGYEDGNIYPNKEITREEAFKILAKGFDFKDSKCNRKFKDYSQTGFWSRSYINSLINKGYIDGFTDGTIRAKEKITRAEVVKLLNNIVGDLDYEDSIVDGNLIIRKDISKLENKYIKGNLYIQSEFLKEDFTLENLHIEGNIYILGKKSFQLKVKDSKLKNIISKKARVKLILEENADIEKEIEGKNFIKIDKSALIKLMDSIPKKLDSYSESSIKNLEKAMKLPENNQKDIDSKILAIKESIKKLEKISEVPESEDSFKENPVSSLDRTELDKLIASIPEDLENYTDLSIESLIKAKSLPESSQEEIDRKILELRRAILNLEKKKELENPAPNLDRTELDKLIASIPEDLENYTYLSIESLIKAKNLPESSQEEIDRKILELRRAILNLEKKQELENPVLNLDRTELDKLIASIPEDLENYTDLSIESLIKAKNLPESSQEEIDRKIVELRRAILNLEKKQKEKKGYKLNLNTSLIQLEAGELVKVEGSFTKSGLGLDKKNINLILTPLHHIGTCQTDSQGNFKYIFKVNKTMDSGDYDLLVRASSFEDFSGLTEKIRLSLKGKENSKIKEIVEPEAIDGFYNSLDSDEFETLKLPDKVQVIYKDGSSGKEKVSWDLKNFNPIYERQYILYGYLDSFDKPVKLKVNMKLKQHEGIVRKFIIEDYEDILIEDEKDLVLPIKYKISLDGALTSYREVYWTSVGDLEIGENILIGRFNFAGRTYEFDQKIILKPKSNSIDKLEVIYNVEKDGKILKENLSEIELEPGKTYPQLGHLSINIKNVDKLDVLESKVYLEDDSFIEIIKEDLKLKLESKSLKEGKTKLILEVKLKDGSLLRDRLDLVVKKPSIIEMEKLEPVKIDVANLADLNLKEKIRCKFTNGEIEDISLVWPVNLDLKLGKNIIEAKLEGYEETVSLEIIVEDSKEFGQLKPRYSIENNGKVLEENIDSINIQPSKFYPEVGDLIVNIENIDNKDIEETKIYLEDESLISLTQRPNHEDKGFDNTRVRVYGKNAKEGQTNLIVEVKLKEGKILKHKLPVDISNLKIQSVEKLDPLIVDIEELEKISLPESIEVKLSDGSLRQEKVKWNTEYLGLISESGEYTLIGDVLGYGKIQLKLLVKDYSENLKVKYSVENNGKVLEGNIDSINIQPSKFYPEVGDLIVNIGNIDNKDIEETKIYLEDESLISLTQRPNHEDKGFDNTRVRVYGKNAKEGQTNLIVEVKLKEGKILKHKLPVDISNLKIQSVEKLDPLIVDIEELEKISLPESIEVKLSDGSKVKKPVVWDMDILSMVWEAGKVKVKGKIDDYEGDIWQVVNVIEVLKVEEVEELEEIIIYQGDTVTLPKEIEAEMSNFETKKLEIEWEEASKLKIGENLLKGKLKGYDYEVSIKVIVKKKDSNNQQSLDLSKYNPILEVFDSVDYGFNYIDNKVRLLSDSGLEGYYYTIDYKGNIVALKKIDENADQWGLNITGDLKGEKGLLKLYKGVKEGNSIRAPRGEELEENLLDELELKFTFPQASTRGADIRNNSVIRPEVYNLAI